MLPELSNAVSAAQNLLGWKIVRQTERGVMSGLIVETEAYSSEDAASHTFKGETKRNATMFREAGHAYVYFTYGMHYCFNVVTGRAGQGQGVLIRALEPVDGIDLMQQNRSMEHNLTNGPAKLCKALQIDKRLNGHFLLEPPLQLQPGIKVDSDKIVTTIRVGISKDMDRPWRFYIANNPHVSKV